MSGQEARRRSGAGPGGQEGSGGGVPGGRPGGGSLGRGGAVLAAAALGYAHLAGAGAVDPMSDLVSDYALHDATAWALVAGTLALASACLWTAYGLARTDPARSAAARVLLVAGALGLLLTAVFPTDAAPGVTSIAGEIHRWSAAVVFTALPCAGRLLGRRSGGLALPAVSAACVALLAAFLAAHPGSPVAELVGGPDYYGLIERLLLLAEITLVLLAAGHASGRRPPEAAGRPPGRQGVAGRGPGAAVLQHK
ncbi:DUF998 domain-containing protein [Planomonospora sp. ID82291]|uniref:DUF998 domain-containing protein n=1 Tax=Planomonospora sp. ID82291 TaxID=2738136 RepID=UPI0018C44816|nr:DUF998 domain-containing protein [Planomonospora sp. ID82291]MBG0812852.1 DUF998 domain-containing protein [Planomonospora sp. ID82291]